MKKYDTYKDSGIEWLGEIPEHWEVEKLKFSGKIYAGLSGKSGNDFSKEPKENHKPYIPFTNIYNNTVIDVNDYHFVKIDEHEQQNYVKNNDLLFLMSSETLEDIGKNALFKDKTSVFLNSFCKGFRINDKNVYPEYLNYLLLASPYREYFAMVARGFTRINLKQEYILNMPILKLDLKEQQKIATFLDEKTSKIDQTIAQKEALISLLKERKQIIIQDLVTGKKVWNEEKQAWTKPEKVKDSGVEWIGEIPEGWEVKNLRYGFKFLNHRRIPLSAVERDDLKGNYPYYGASGIIDYVNDYIFDEKTILIAEDGANLLSKSTPLAFVAEGKYWVNNHAHILKPKYKGFRYWAELLSLIDYTIYISGAAQPKLSRENLGSVKIIVPSKSEIEVISQYIESQSSKIDQAINIQEQQIEKLKEYKATLIDSAVTGKVRVS